MWSALGVRDVQQFRRERNGGRIAVVGALAAVFVVAGSACSGGGGSEASDAGDTGAPIEEDSRGPDGPSWETEFVETGGWGAHVDLAVSADGNVGLAYFAAEGRDEGDCSEVGDPAPPKLEVPLRYAARDEGSWTVETVDELLYVGASRGLDLDWGPDGAPRIAAMIGEPLESFGYCGANDAGLYRREGEASWSSQTVVSSSDAAAVDKEGADFGEVVGYWPALAYDADGRAAMAYKDVHAGGRQADDFKIASLEVALQGGEGWAAKSVDPYRGAGDRARIVFDDQNRPVVVYVIEKESQTENQLGVWAARSDDGGESWKRVQLFSGATRSRPAVAVAPESGNLHVLFYNSERGFPELAVLEEPSKIQDVSEGWRFRETGIANNGFDSGYDPSIVFGPDGELHAVFYRCTVATSGLGDCNRREDGLVHAWREGNRWSREVVDPTDDALCGTSPTMGFDGSGRPVVAYQCGREVEGNVERGIKFAIEK
jgi:hypothetical protein